ncbi:MAG: YcaO-like family protein, partial [Candidatus Sungiibacteriota bacterium]
MEIEQEKSEFFEPSGIAISSAVKFFNRSAGEFKFMFSGAEAAVDDKMRKTISLAYDILDSVAGEKSFIFYNSEMPGFKPYHSIIEFLFNRKTLKYFNFNKTRWNDAPAFYGAQLVGEYPPGSTDGNTALRHHGFSFSKNAEEVLSKSIGEFLERYFLTVYKKRRLVRSSPKSLQEKGRRHLDLNLLASFSESQKIVRPRRLWNDKSVFLWEEAERLSTQEKTLIPAQLVYWNYILDNEAGEPFLLEQNTNGCGGYFSKEGAILSGLYELIQRDAFLIYWLNEAPPPRIEPESVPDKEFQKILAESKRYGFKIQCLNTTLDTGIPSFIVLVIDPSEKGPHLSMGAGCGSNPAYALRRALEEAWSIYCWMRGNEPFLLPHNYE